MADSEHSELIAEFCKVTGVDTNKARFYLEANGWNSDIAMSSFFEEGEDDQPVEELPSLASFPPSGSPKAAAPQRNAGSSRIATFASLANSAANDSDEEGQAFYAGGSERSGQQVIGPGKKRAVGNEVVEEMFKAVKKFGGEVVDPVYVKEGQGQKTKLKAFRGAGFVLGSTSEASNAAVGNPSADANEAPREVQICLRLWRNGFTVNDLPLRDYQAPESRAFLDSVRKGEVPDELMGKEGEFHLDIEDHSQVDYAPRRQTMQAFSGTGFRLGNIAPVVTQAAKPSEKNAADAQEGLKLDESKPVTTIQIRLADGSRLIMKANHSHTIGDVRRFIVSARPEFSSSVFTLMTAFPSKELADDSATLEQENLLNSVIVQKMKQ